MTDKEGKSALAYACYQGHLNVARELIARGAQCDLLDKEGVAAIHWAALEVSVTCTKQHSDWIVFDCDIDPLL